MGNKINRRGKARSSTSKQNSIKNATVKQTAKKRHQKWSKDRSERARDALNRDADLLYNFLENSSTAPPPIPQVDFMDSLAENMQSLGK